MVPGGVLNWASMIAERSQSLEQMFSDCCRFSSLVIGAPLETLQPSGVQLSERLVLLGIMEAQMRVPSPETLETSQRNDTGGFEGALNSTKVHVDAICSLLLQCGFPRAGE